MQPENQLSHLWIDANIVETIISRKVKMARGNFPWFILDLASYGWDTNA
jgi:hypothetical protein